VLAGTGAPVAPDPSRPVGDTMHFLLDCPLLADNRARLWVAVRAAIAGHGGVLCDAVAALEDKTGAFQRLVLLLGGVPADPELAPGEPEAPLAWPEWAARAAAAPAAWGVLDLWERRKELLYGGRLPAADAGAPPGVPADRVAGPGAVAAGPALLRGGAPAFVPGTGRWWGAGAPGADRHVVQGWDSHSWLRQ
jgi:hypothetical protein